MKKLKELFRKIFLAAAVIAVVSVLHGCKQHVKTVEGGAGEITVTIQSDENVIVNVPSFTVKQGTKWGDVRTNAAVTGISFKSPFRFDMWRLGSSVGIKLTDDYVFNEKQIIFAVSTQCMKVPYSELDKYLKTKALDNKMNYIEVTDIPEGKLKGTDSDKYAASELGMILKKNKTKKVSLKLPEVIEKSDDMSFCFFEVPNLYSISSIPEGIKNIRACFAGCTNLIEAPALPKGITDMSDCFSRCINLEKVPNIPEGVKNMSLCFALCKKLTAAPVILKGVLDMSACFKDCIELKYVPPLPNGIEDMGECFSGCINLQTPPDIPQGASNIWACFFGCSNMTKVPAVPEGVTDMSKCFEECISITETPILPNSVTNMKKCFADCEKLQTVHNIPQNVTDMTYAFGGCENIKTIPQLPKGVISMDYCFTRCKNLESIPNIPETVKSMHSCFLVCENLEQCPPIPEKVFTMTFCFLGCGRIKNITLNCAYNDEDNGNGMKNFYDTFRKCSFLEKGSIKVKAEHLQAYKKNAELMNINGDRFAAQ